MFLLAIESLTMDRSWLLVVIYILATNVGYCLMSATEDNAAVADDFMPQSKYNYPN